ncbi:MAG: hypothetical protein KatS3mg105_5155 [Gemmatales bacterium]|nr:MAG: hypothetical protein KatS3mg105_5155 [Gemmatales bacterium]GIW97834.1 MAG: hypothetical protein KatS3mg111_1167 [Pirellulaceae bacterium]
MTQKSTCHRCGAYVESMDIEGNRAFFRCSCGRRWSTTAYYGCHTPSGGAILTGAIIGGLMGGIPGAIVGGVLGSLVGKTSTCLRCGSTAQPTGHRGNKTMYQCTNCYRTWVQSD